MNRRLKIQIGVRPGSVKGDGIRLMIWFINKNPITLYMAVESAFPFPMKRMVTVLWGQRFPVHNHFHNLAKLCHFHAAFLQQFDLFFEACRINGFKHTLIVVVTHKIFPHGIK